MWSDNETIEDLIGLRVHSDLIAEVVIDPKLLPGIRRLGDGKTSITKILQARLERNEDIAARRR